MGAIRVLVVEDSLTIRKRLCDVLSADPMLAVVGEADNGQQAIARCQELRPDVITLDMMLPVMNGLAATEYIMAHVPTPILIVSASTNRGELFHTYEALAAGAVDVLDKPRGDEISDGWERRLVETVKLVSRIRVVTHPRARLGAMGHARTERPPVVAPESATGRHRLIAIGASTGGPGAILDILRALPTPFPLPILFALHIGEPFGEQFAAWLDSQTPMSVSYARDGDLVSEKAGQVVMAPPESHLTIERGRVRLTQDPPRHSCRPSIDVMFESAAREYGATLAAALLTGMGRDGAAGLLAVRRAGGFTIAQDEASSVVYGMPREAVMLGAVDRELPLAQIGPALAALAMSAAERRTS